jgi:hypothetical protein
MTNHDGRNSEADVSGDWTVAACLSLFKCCDYNAVLGGKKRNGQGPSLGNLCVLYG